jgi:hypothetical protein
MGSLLLAVLLSWLSSPGASESMSFSPPAADEEEQLSTVLPERYKCDGCRAVAFQLAQAFGRTESRRGESTRGHALPEWQYMEIIDETCEGGFDDYGMKQPESVGGGKQGAKGAKGAKGAWGDKGGAWGKVLSGPGVPGGDMPGVTMGGGKWPGRLAMLCGTMVGDVGEDVVYGMHRTALIGGMEAWEAGKGAGGGVRAFQERLCLEQFKCKAFKGVWIRGRRVRRAGKGWMGGWVDGV